MSLEKQVFSPISRRRFLQYSGTAVLGGSLLAACGGTGGNNSGITLKQWYHQYGEEGTQQAVKRYAKEYKDANIEVNWVAGDYFAKLNAALLSSSAPDVFEGHPNIDMVKAGQIEPLDDIIGPVKDEFNPVGLKPLTINGKIYAIKMIDDMGLLYYRKSLLSKAGIQPPTTMDELIAAAKKLTTKSMKGLFIGNDGGVAALKGPALWSAGNDFLTDDNKIAFDNDRTVLAIKKVKELYQSNSLLIGAPTDWWDPSAFTQNLAAMQYTGLWAMPAVQKALGDDFGVVPWPKLDEKGRFSTFYSGWEEMVYAKGKHVEEAKKYIKWLWIDNTEAQKDWATSYGFHIPPRKKAAESAETLQKGPAKEAAEILKSYGFTTSPLWNGPMDVAYGDALTNVLKNNANPEQELSKLVQKTEAELKRVLA